MCWKSIPASRRADVQACLDYASRVMGNHFSVVTTAWKGFSFSMKTCPRRLTFRAETSHHFRRQPRRAAG